MSVITLTFANVSLLFAILASELVRAMALIALYLVPVLLIPVVRREGDRPWL